MGKLGSFAEVWSALKERIFSSEGDGAALEQEAAPTTTMGKVGRVLRLTGVWLFRLRKVFMAAPVVFFALRLASYNMNNLPEQVGLNLQTNGEFAQMIDRSMAVYGPLGITGVCLLLMFFSRKGFHPWVISIFTLVVPIVLLLTNLYPQ